MTDAGINDRYALSFTTGALLTRDAALLAPAYLEARDWEKTRDRAVADNLLQARTHRTRVRFVRETVKRLSALTDQKLEILGDLTVTERGHLMWVAACRRYSLIAEFAEDVLRERFLLLAPTLSYEGFASFIRSKALWHDELATIADSTLQKLRRPCSRCSPRPSCSPNPGTLFPRSSPNDSLTLLTFRTPSDVRFFPTRSAA